MSHRDDAATSIICPLLDCVHQYNAWRCRFVSMENHLELEGEHGRDFSSESSPDEASAEVARVRDLAYATLVQKRKSPQSWEERSLYELYELIDNLLARETL